MRARRAWGIIAAGCGAWAVLLIVLLALRTNAAVAEWWSTHISAAYVAVVGRIFSVLPFSVFECLVVAAIVWGAGLIGIGIYGLIKKKGRAVLAGLLAVAVFAVQIGALYTATAGFAYNRNRIAYPEPDGLDEATVLAAADWYRDELACLSGEVKRDENGNVVCPYSTHVLSEKIGDAYAKADIAGLYAYTPKAKEIVNSWWLSWLGIAGITFLPTAEPNVNAAMPAFEQTVTIAHETAHAKGVAREGDANLVAMWVLLLSDDPYLNYCATVETYAYMRQAVYITTRDEESLAAYPYPQAVVTELRNANAYWDAQPQFFEKIAEFFNNIYLKLNGVPNGTGSYGDGSVAPVPPFDDPDYEPVYSTRQKIMFAVYQTKNAD